jgi:hypothetical protein
MYREGMKTLSLDLRERIVAAEEGETGLLGDFLPWVPRFFDKHPSHIDHSQIRLKLNFYVPKCRSRTKMMSNA